MGGMEDSLRDRVVSFNNLLIALCRIPDVQYTRRSSTLRIVGQPYDAVVGLYTGVYFITFLIK
jgi:hypothetical protein